jgi:acetyl-CoA C-acetyltransferase
MRDVHLAGVGHTPFGRSDRSLLDLVEEAAEGALRTASPTVDGGGGGSCSAGRGGGGKGGIDAVVVGVMAPTGTLGEAHITSKVMDRLCLAPRPAIRVESGPATGAAALHAGAWAVASGAHDTVLVVAAEKLSHLGSREASGVLARIATAEERSLGLTMPGMTAMLARAYMHRWGATPEDLADVAVKAHEHASRNPLAHLRRRVTREEVLAAPMVADPLRRHNCAPLSDGAVAAVLTSRPGALVRLAGMGAATDRVRYQDRRAVDGFPATLPAAGRALRMAGAGPADVDVVETHDAFSNLEWSNIEDLGLMAPGEALAAFRRGDTGLSGPLPVNPSGGLTAKGHPVGASGLGEVAEVFWQLTGEARGRQVDGARLGLAHSIGGFGASVFVTVLEAA